MLASRYFYPRPPRGGRHTSADLLNTTPEFLSTPSARRATTWETFILRCVRYFYPRPPRGGRRPKLKKDMTSEEAFLSTPSARRATKVRAEAKKEKCKFLSTPSARRATAKTERKPSAFVSLYTSLHKLQRGACKTNRRITPLLVQTAGIPVRSVRENYVRCLFALAGHQKISTLSCANSGCSPTCSTLVW